VQPIESRDQYRSITKNSARLISKCREHTPELAAPDDAAAEFDADAWAEFEANADAALDTAAEFKAGALLDMAALFDAGAELAAAPESDAEACAEFDADAAAELCAAGAGAATSLRRGLRIWATGVPGRSFL
jgi:hypothetical protein